MALEYLWLIFWGSLPAMAVIVLAATGEIINESAGLFNIGLEGIILASAMTGALGASVAGPTAGLLVGIVTGCLIGLIFGSLSSYFQGEQLIIGVGINLLALGLVAFWLIFLGVPGHYKIPEEMLLVDIKTPLGKISPVVLLALTIPIISYWLLFKTKLGIKIRAVGEHPQAADIAGVNVRLIRLCCCAFGASLAGLAGAFMSVDWMGFVTKQMSAGRGFIALATVVFSGLNPLLALVGGFIFGFFDNLAMWVTTGQHIKLIIPYEFIRMVPYIMTLLVVAGAIGRTRFPSALGKPYLRE